MGWLFTDYCAGCGVSDDKEDLISVNGTVYELGTARGANLKVCAKCYKKIKEGKAKNFSLRE
jgi:hypothetical protein